MKTSLLFTFILLIFYVASAHRTLGDGYPGAFHDIASSSSQPSNSTKSFPFNLFEPVVLRDEERAALNETDIPKFTSYAGVVHRAQKGLWKLAKNLTAVDLFSHQKGTARIVFKYLKGRPLKRDIEVSFYDGAHQPDGVLHFEIHDFQYNFSEKIQSHTEAVNVTYSKNFREQSRKFCNLTVSFDFSRVLQRNEVSDVNDSVSVHISSYDCSLPTGFGFIPSSHELYQVLIFCSLALFSLLISFWVFFRLGLKIFNHIEAVKLSGLPFVVFLAWDMFAVVGLTQIVSIYKTYLLLLGPLIALYAIKAFCLDLRVLIVLWKWTDHYKNHTGFAARMMDFVMLGVVEGFIAVLLYFTSLNNFIAPFLALSLVPQIYHNVQREERPDSFQNYYILLSFLNVLPLAYFKVDRYNFLNIETSTIFVVLMAILLMGQTIILMLQMRLGATFFIPSQTRVLKQKYVQSVKTNEIAPNEDFELPSMQ